MYADNVIEVLYKSNRNITRVLPFLVCSSVITVKRGVSNDDFTICPSFHYKKDFTIHLVFQSKFVINCFYLNTVPFCYYILKVTMKHVEISNNTCSKMLVSYTGTFLLYLNSRKLYINMKI